MHRFISGQFISDRLIVAAQAALTQDIESRGDKVLMFNHVKTKDGMYVQAIRHMGHLKYVLTH